jgi:hypothetical protein
MNTSDAEQGHLPDYTAEELAGLDADGLITLLMRNEDRVPRALIEECARRGEAMLKPFATLIEPGEFWSPDAIGLEWWLRLHMAMILGLIPGERAGSLLVGLMRRIEQTRDNNLQDWLSGYWPALFRNKPDTVEPPLRELAQDRAVNWYMRIQAIESVVSLGGRRGVEALDANLDWVASIAADESDDWELRLSTGNTLLDFPRARHRALLEDLAARQSGWGVHFALDDIEEAFSSGDKPEWRRHFDDPWNFYAPEEITKRQQRWAEEEERRLAREAGALDDDALDDADDLADEDVDRPPEPYVRVTPKIGRNDPCLCGSGKKYKKCCLT